MIGYLWRETTPFSLIGYSVLQLDPLQEYKLNGILGIHVIGRQLISSGSKLSWYYRLYLIVCELLHTGFALTCNDHHHTVADQQCRYSECDFYEELLQ